MAAADYRGHSVADGCAAVPGVRLPERHAVPGLSELHETVTDESLRPLSTAIQLARTRVVSDTIRIYSGHFYS